MDEQAIRTAAQAHVARFNRAVQDGDWTAFAATFAVDAVMRFTNVPVGPFEGRAAIEGGYRAQPPDDTMTIRTIEGIRNDTALVAFTWDANGAGTMRITWTDDLVQELVITFG